jgi:hypothetical protein
MNQPPRPGNWHCKHLRINGPVHSSFKRRRNCIHFTLVLYRQNFLRILASLFGLKMCIKINPSQERIPGLPPSVFPPSPASIWHPVNHLPQLPQLPQPPQLLHKKSPAVNQQTTGERVWETTVHREHQSSTVGDAASDA